MSIFTHFDSQVIINLTSILDTFGKITNLKLNKAKTSISVINREATLNDITVRRPENCYEEVNLNWKKVINSINLVSFKIRSLRLPLLQTIKALKTFVLSKIS